MYLSANHSRRQSKRIHGLALLTGYPPNVRPLLERIIQASSNEGDVVLDPFCGCGTTIAAAQKLNRQWIGIDITHLSVGLMKLRLKDSFGIAPGGRTLLSARDSDTTKTADVRTEVSALQTYCVGQPTRTLPM